MIVTIVYLLTTGFGNTPFSTDVMFGTAFLDLLLAMIAFGWGFGVRFE